MPLAPRLRAPLSPLALLATGAALAALAACGAPKIEPDPTSRRSPPAGEVVGFTGAYGSHVWKGIPYAEPPVGGLRWRAPRPAPRWQGVREALATGTACPQFASVFAGEGRDAKGVIGEEDCLYLDVYAPRREPETVPEGESRWPVLVWIHGGGNSIGRAGFYDGGNLAATHDVVVVAMNYRLGPLGWFRHAALRGAGSSGLDRSGNFGTLDTIRALEWVRDNVGAFGGDPDNVTILGESAGGGNVFALLLSPLAEGLFQRAMVESGGLDFATKEQAESWSDAATPGRPTSSNEIVARLLERDGTVADRREAKAHIASMGDAALRDYLDGKSPRELLEAYTGEGEAFGGMIPVPTRIRDGAVLPADEPMDRIARGAYNQVPLILGTNRDENKLFMAFDPEFARWRFGLFPQAHDPDRYDAHSDTLARAWKARSVDRPAALARKAQGPSVWAYRWDWDEEPSVPWLYDGGRMLGAGHGLEIPFFFGHWDLGPDTKLLFRDGNREGREALSRRMMSYLAEFAYSGAPGRGRGGDLPPWRPWDDSTVGAPRYVVFDTDADGGVRMTSDTWTVDRVVKETLADPRFHALRDRCFALRQLADWGYFGRERYETAGSGTCAAFAYDAWPWKADGAAVAAE